MDISPWGLARNVGPQIPSLFKTAILGALGYSENTHVQDVITELIAIAGRPILGTPISLLKAQAAFNYDIGIFGRVWVSKYTIPATRVPSVSRNDVYSPLEAILHAINKIGNGNEVFDMPEVRPVEAEWTGYRSNAWPTSPRPSISEKAQYQSMMAEVDENCPTILYLHGGAFCLMDPSTHRWPTSALAKASRGRCFCVRHRLAPQYPFPAALLDAFTAYLGLIAPPPGAFHAAVPPSNIVISGDSSGACLAASLYLLLTNLHRLNLDKIHWSFSLPSNSSPDTLTIPSPPIAGLALTSPWLDVSRALPSVYRNARYDIIRPPSSHPSIPGATPPFPPDAIWPTTPPRVETYCNAAMVIHPLVSPVAAGKELLRGGTPVHVVVGWEGMQDEAEVWSRRLASAGVRVEFDGYEGMPHCFAMVPWNAAGRSAFEEWARFCRECVLDARKDIGQDESNGDGNGNEKSKATWTDKHGNVKEVRTEDLGMMAEGEGHEREGDLDDRLVDEFLAYQREWRVEREVEIQEEWQRGEYRYDVKYR